MLSNQRANELTATADRLEDMEKRITEIEGKISIIFKLLSKLSDGIDSCNEGFDTVYKFIYKSVDLLEKDIKRLQA